MLKKLLISGLILGGLILNANIATAQDAVFIKKEMLAPSLILHEPQENVSVPCVHQNTETQDTTPCPNGFMKEEEPFNQPCSTDKPCDLAKPCPDGYMLEENANKPCEKTLPCAKNEPCPKMQKFFNEIDTKIGLTPEQQVQADVIRKETCAKIKPLKMQLMNKKCEIASLQRTKMSHIEIEKRTNVLNKEIKNIKKDIKAIKENADKQYKKILTPEQKKTYASIKKELKGKEACCEKCPQNCKKDCPCGKENCDCKKPCSCEDCKCDENNNCGCKDACDCKISCAEGDEETDKVENGYEIE